MEQIMDVIKRRMSYHAYLDKPLPEEVVTSILEAAKYAPTARNQQELEYKVISNKTLIQKITDTISAELKKEGRGPQGPGRSSFFHGAPLVIIITGPADNPWIYSDAALATQNIMLYATSINLGTCFIGMTRFIEKAPEMLKELHIAEGMKIAATVICGYPNEKPPAKEKRIKAEYFR